MRRLLLLLVLLVVALGAVLVLRAASFRSRQIAVEPAAPLAFDRDAAARRFAGAVRFRTVSSLDRSTVEWEEFRGLHRYLEEQFPLVHQKLKRETVSDYTLVYTWPGTDPSLEPAVLLSHQDVVPVEPGTEGKWAQPPFEGRIVDGYVWGRGTLDDKFGVLGLLQSAELLLVQGYQPRRTFILAFGHDEEVGGYEGAERVAEVLRARGVRAAFVLDEGGAVVTGAVPGLERRVGLIGTAEKGSVTLELRVDTDGGHSSTPPEHTAIGIVSAAVRNVENQQMPMRLSGPVQQMIEYLGPELPFRERLALGNLWLVEPFLDRLAGSQPAIAATLRTSTAATMIHGGVKENVLPSSARATVNFRILPGDSIASVTEHVRRAVNDPRVEIVAVGEGREPSIEAPIDNDSFRLLQRTIGEVFPDALVAPFLVLGGTDARNYTVITDRVYRFTPILADNSDLKRIHGIDERMSVDNYAQAVHFFARLFTNAGG